LSTAFDALRLVTPLMEQRATKGPSAPPRDPVIAGWYGYPNTAAGKNVTPDTAMGIAAVFSCVTVLSESMGSVPLNLYKYRKGGGKEIDDNNSLYGLLHDQPNEFQTSQQFIEMLTGHACLRGAGYAEIRNRIDGMELIPLHPDLVFPYKSKTPTGKTTIAFEYFDPELNGKSRIILRNEMLYLWRFGLDLFTPLSPITMHREGLALTMALQEHGARLFSNGVQAGGVLQTAQAFKNAEAIERLRDQFAKRYAGLANAHKPLILEQGMEWKSIGMNMGDAQFLESRAFQRSEIAGIFRVPAHFINDLEHATFSNIHHLDLAFVKWGLLPWVRRWEQAIQRDLVVNKKKNFARFNLNGLLRGDSATRKDFYSAMRQWGIFSANDVRELEDLNPIEGGDVYLSPSNMLPADMLGKTPAPKEPDDPPAEDKPKEEDKE